MSPRLGALCSFRRRRPEEIEAHGHWTRLGRDYRVNQQEKARRLGVGQGPRMGDPAMGWGSVRASAPMDPHDKVAGVIRGGDGGLGRHPPRMVSCDSLGPDLVIPPGGTHGEGWIIGAPRLVLHDLLTGSKLFGVPGGGPAILSSEGL